MLNVAPQNWVIRPPAPPERFWLTPEIEPLQMILDEGDRPFTQDELMEYHRLRGREDFFFFSKYIWGLTRMSEKLHGPACWAWQAPNGTPRPQGGAYDRFRMGTMPRGHLKTTVLTQAYAAWRLVRNQEERILLYTSNFTMAKKLYAPIRSMFEGRGRAGKFFLNCYGDIIPSKKDREKWTDNMLTVKRDNPYTDASLEATGIGANINGSHFTFEGLDDLIGRQETREQMEKIFTLFDNLDPLYDSLRTGERRFVCTPWAFYDLVTYVESYWPEAMAFRRCWQETEDGRPIVDEADYSEENMIFEWCDVATAKTLKRRNPYFFSCQYECWPRDDKSMGFQRGWFRYFQRNGDFLQTLDRDGQPEKRRVALANCNVFLVVDPSIGEVPGSQIDMNKAVTGDLDFCGAVVIAVDPENNWYVLDAVRERLNPQDVCEMVFEKVAYWSPRAVGFESVGAQRLYWYLFQEKWKQGRPFFNLREWKGGKASKIDRIGSLIPRHKEGFIFYRTGGPESVQRVIEQVQMELLQWPYAQHDDASDALSGCHQFVWMPGAEPRQTDAAHLKSLEEREIERLDPTSQRVWRAMAKKGKKDLFSLGADWLNLGGDRAA